MIITACSSALANVLLKLGRLAISPAYTEQDPGIVSNPYLSPASPTVPASCCG
jgi:hypothetical protein